MRCEEDKGRWGTYILVLDIMDSKIDSLTDLSKVKGFKLVHLNVRSLTKKIDQVRLMFSGLNLDVLTISETWLNKSVSSGSVALNYYTLYRQDRNFATVKKKRGGGLLTYIRTDHAVNSEPLPDNMKSNQDIEAQWTMIHRPHCKNVIVGNVYRPPAGKLKNFLEHLDGCLRGFDLEKVDVYILGDMNVNYKNKTSNDYKKLNFFVKCNGLVQAIESTTRNNDKTNSLLDLILTNTKYTKCAGTLDHFISDHQPIYIVKKKSRDHRSKVEFKGRSYRNYDKEAMRKRLTEDSWDEFYRINDPNLAWDFMLGKFLPILDKMCPIRTFQIKNYRPDWVTHELMEQIQDRDYFYSRAKKLGDEDAWNIAEKCY